MGTLSPSLRRLFNEIDARWPNRDRRTDGWMRTPAEGISVGHNPGARGLTHAIDVDRDGLDPMHIINSVYRSSSVMYYIIWDRRVWSTKTGWDGHRYTGSNPHTDHLHIEIYQTVTAENYAGSWGLSGDSHGIGTAPGFDPGDGTWSQGLGAADDRNPAAPMGASTWLFNTHGNDVMWRSKLIRDVR